MEAQPTWTDVAQLVVVGLQLVVLVAAAVVARNQLKEAQTLREEQTRPFVVIDLESPQRPFFDLVVKNIGPTLARDISFKFTPPAESTIDEVMFEKLKMFRDGISTLPPGKEIRTLFDSGIQRHPSPLPDEYEVVVRYSGPSGKTYEEKIDLDFGLYWDRLHIVRKDVHDVHEELTKLRKEFSAWRKSRAS